MGYMAIETKKFKSTSSETFIKSLPSTKGFAADEEILLIQRAKQGDKHAQDELVMGNIGFIRKTSKDIFLKIGKAAPTVLQEFEEADSVQLGIAGFLRAIEAYKISKGVKLCTYAFWWVNRDVRRGLAKKLKTISSGSARTTLRMPYLLRKSFDERYKDFSLFAPDVFDHIEGDISVNVMMYEAFLTDQEKDVVTRSLGLTGAMIKKKDLAKEMRVPRNKVGEIYKNGINKIRTYLAESNDIEFSPKSNRK